MTTDQSSSSSSPGNHPNPPDAERGKDFFDRIRRLGVLRPAEDRWVAGVCVGLARRWDVDPVLVRAVTIVLTVLGPGLLLYGLAWALIPQEDGRLHAERVLSGEVTAGFVGACLAVLAGTGGGVFPGWGGQDGWGSRGGFVLTAAVAAGVWFWYRRHGGRWPRTATGTPMTGYAARRAGTQPAWTMPGTGGVAEPAPTPSGPTAHEPTASAPSPTGSPWSPQPVTEESGRPGRYRRDPRIRASRPFTRAVVVLAAVVGYAAFALADSDGSHRAGTLAAAAALTVLGLGVVIAALRGRRSGGLMPLALLLLLGLAANSLTVGTLSVASDATWLPSTTDTARSNLAGNLTVDLSSLSRDAASTSPTHLRLRAAASHVRIEVPQGALVAVDVGYTAAQVTCLNQPAVSGAGRLTCPAAGTEKASATILLSADVLASDVEVVTVPATTTGVSP